ncbi:MAG: SDR family NAD(P)-dependent oxidoreductase [Ignavibacteriae bacterium]|nr:SDR family NAD(P)-dependent oxidoreductase [Ignavibacteriota bacterium]
MKIINNTIVITGGASGIGFAMAKRFAELNNRVIIVGRDILKLKNAKKSNKNIDYLKCDLTNQQEFDSLIVALENKYPELNILINNASIQFNYYFTKENSLLNKIEKEINTNFAVPIKLCFHLIPMLSNKSESAIINVSSGLAFAPKENAPVYCATKAAIHSFSTSLRYQLENTNIKIFELIPPLVNTPMTEGREGSKLEPEELVNEFLASFKKNSYEINIGKIKLLRRIQRFFPAPVSKKIRFSS